MGGFSYNWTFGNEKIAKLRTVGFSIPAFQSKTGFKTCPGAGACAAVCYARQGRFMFGAVARAYEENLARVLADLPGFADKAIADLRRMKSRKTVRVHTAGDFFSQEYLDSWYKIAKALPDKKFYAYTKSLTFQLYANKPDNFQIIQSEGGIHDKLIRLRRAHARIFANDKARRKAGYGNGSNTDLLAIRGVQKIGLIHHGNRKLTPAQKQYFS
jgi:hypothetical protein